MCRCDCGTERSVQGYNLSSGKSKSCGCLSAEIAKGNNLTHGMCESLEYKTWMRMIQRCENEHNPSYHNYGGRGISVCSKWRLSFLSFYEDMGDKPSENHSIDRIDNDGNYEPGNCRWATRSEQMFNRRGWRNSSTNVKGVTLSNGKYSALFKLKGKKRIERCFSINKYGKENAFKLACDARKKMLEQYDII